MMPWTRGRSQAIFYVRFRTPRPTYRELAAEWKISIPRVSQIWYKGYLRMLRALRWVPLDAETLPLLAQDHARDLWHVFGPGEEHLGSGLTL